MHRLDQFTVCGCRYVISFLLVSLRRRNRTQQKKKTDTVTSLYLSVCRSVCLSVYLSATWLTLSLFQSPPCKNKCQLKYLQFDRLNFLCGDVQHKVGEETATLCLFCNFISYVSLMTLKASEGKSVFSF